MNKMSCRQLPGPVASLTSQFDKITIDCSGTETVERNRSTNEVKIIMKTKSTIAFDKLLDKFRHVGAKHD